MGDLIASDRTADRLLLLLKSHGSVTTASLAERLGITVPGVRQHLNRLETEGVVQSERRRAGVGRPARVWTLTEAGHRRFPDTHAETLVSVLETMRRTLGEDALDRVIASRAHDTERAYRRRLAACTALGARLEALAQCREEDGYMAELIEEGPGRWLLAENHCPICAAARACQGFCRNELELFRRLVGPDADVVRTEYLLDGARRCAYRVTQRERDNRPEFP